MHSFRLASFVFVFSFFLFAVGCCGLPSKIFPEEAIPEIPGVTGPQAGGEAEWTVMIFMNGDNNLEPAGISDFLEMEAVGSSDKVNIVVQFARSPGYTDAEGDWSGARRYLIEKGNGLRMSSTPLAELGDVDMGSPDAFYDFVSWAIGNYPAKKYALVFWDHGGGWTGMNQDETTKTDMNLPEMRQLLERVKGKLGRKIDIVVFDMCLMAQYDVLLDVAPYADYMVASEEIIPLDSFNYTSVFEALTAQPEMTPRELALLKVEKYAEFYEFEQEATTLSAFDLSKSGELKTAFDNFFSVLDTRAKQGGWRDVAEMHQYAEHYVMGGPEERIFSFGDLYDFASNAEAYALEDAMLLDAAVKLEQAINETIISNYNHPKHPRSYGITYYFQPSRALYEQLNSKDYLKTTAYNQPAWRTFLTDYYNAENFAALKPEVTEFKVSPTASLIRPIKFSYTMSGSNIMKNQWLQFQQQGGEWKVDRLIGQRAMTKLASGKEVYGFSDGIAKGVGRSSTLEMFLTDGVTDVPVSVESRWPAENFYVISGLFKKKTGEQFEAQMYFYEYNGKPARVQVAFQGADGQQVVGIVKLEDGDQFTPYYYTLAQNSLSPHQSQTLTYNSQRGFEIGWRLLPPGQYFVADLLTDLGGQQGFATANFQVSKQPTLTPLSPDVFTENWECGQIEQGLYVQKLMLLNFSGNACVFEDFEGSSYCFPTYSEKDVSHLYIYLSDRFETVKFVASQINSTAFWLFETAGTDPIICTLAGTGRPSLQVYRELYASIGDNAPELDERLTGTTNMVGEWESAENNMKFSFKNDGSFEWTIGGNKITGTFTADDKILTLTAKTPSPDYSTQFPYLLGKKKLVAYDQSGTSLVFNHPGQELAAPCNAPSEETSSTAQPTPPTPATPTPTTPTPQQPTPTIPAELIGSWANDYYGVIISFDALGYYSWIEVYGGYYFGSYTVQGNTITFNYAGYNVPYTYALSGSQLTITGNGISLTLEKA